MRRKKADIDIWRTAISFDGNATDESLNRAKRKTGKRVVPTVVAVLATGVALFTALSSIKKVDVTAEQKSDLISEIFTSSTTQEPETADASVCETAAADERTAEATELTEASKYSKIVYSEIDKLIDDTRCFFYEGYVFHLALNRELYNKFYQEDDDALFYVLLNTRFTGIRKDIGERSLEDYEKPNVKDNIYCNDTVNYYSKYYRALKEKEKD